MVVSPFQVYGAVGTSVQLGQLVIQFLNDFAGIDDKVISLSLRIKVDLDLLKQFVTFISGLPSELLQESDYDVLKELNTGLQPLMARCEVKIKAARSDSRLQAESAKLAINTIESMAEDLKTWVQHLHIRTSLLSNKLKIDAIKTFGQSDKVLDWQRRVQELSNEMDTRHSRGQSSSNDTLWLPDDQWIDFGGAKQERRMIGMLQGQQVIVEFISIKSAAPPQVARVKIGELATRLNQSEPPVFHVPKCLRCYQLHDRPMYGLVLEIPPGTSSARSLNSLLESLPTKATSSAHTTTTQEALDVKALQHLSKRLAIARDLAIAIRYVHSFGWVHQSVRSSNILIACDDANSKPGSIPTVNAFLAGFERSRPDLGASDQRRIDADWRNNIYRSPDRIAADDEETVRRHTMRHDVYSLGAVLLELGLLESLTMMETQFRRKEADVVRNTMIGMARKQLPLIMGDAYTNLVLYCLELPSEKPLEAVEFVREVIGNLEQLSAIV